jgi:hypothetical protein
MAAHPTVRVDREGGDPVADGRHRPMAAHRTVRVGGEGGDRVADGKFGSNLALLCSRYSACNLR